MGKGVFNIFKQQEERKAKEWEDKAEVLRRKVDDMLAEEGARLVATFMSTHNAIMARNVIVPLTDDEKKILEMKKTNEPIVRS